MFIPKTFAYASVLLLFADVASTQALHPQRAQAILLASLRAEMAKPLALQYRMTIPGRDGTPTETSDWILSGTLARWSGREVRRRAGVVAHVETADRRAATRITRKPGGWVAVRRLRGAHNLLNGYCPMQFCYHGLNTQSVVELLVNHPPMQAWRTEDGLRVLIPLVQTLADDLRAGEEVSGFLAWDVTFAKRGSSYVPLRIRDLETPQIFDPRGDGDVALIDNPRRPVGAELEMILDTTPAVATDSTWFEDFVTVGGITFPLKMHSQSKAGATTVSIDILSVKDRQGDVDPELFAFEVPAGFGDAGRYFDNETGDVRYYGMQTGDEAAAVKTLLVGGQRMGAGPSYEAPRTWSRGRVLTGGVAVLVLLAGFGLLFHGRRRHANS